MKGPTIWLAAWLCGAAMPDLRPASIEGYDASRMIRDVTFENVRIGRRQLKNTDGITVYEFTEKIRFQ